MSLIATQGYNTRTDGNLHAAILAVGRILNIGEMPESIVDHIKDRMRGSLSAAQRHDPHAIYTSQVLGLVTDYVKETYGLDRPVNIHGPGSQAQKPAGDDSSYFDNQGRSLFDRMITGNRIAGFYGGSSAFNEKSAYGYASLSGSTYDPAKGVSSLSPQNFASSPFAGSGLTAADIPIIQMLASQGFSQPAIVQAARFTGELGIDVKGNIAAIARLKRDIPNVETGLRDTKENWATVGRLDQDARKARDQGDFTAAAELQRKADEARQRAEQHDRREQERVRAINPDRVPDLIQVQKATQDAMLTNAKKTGIDPRLIDAAHRGDPEAIEKLRLQREAVAAVPAEAAAVVDLDKAIAENAALRTAVVAQSADRKEAIVAADNKEDDLLADMLGEVAPANPEQPTSVDTKHANAPPAAAVEKADKPANRPGDMRIASVEQTVESDEIAKAKPRPKGPSATV